MTFIDALEELEKTESGGGGIICNFNVATGYKIFVAGMSNSESFFPFDAGNEDSKKAALARAKKALESAGADDKRPNAAVQVLARKATVKGREVGWKEDRAFTYPLWTDGYKKVLKPHLVELGLTPGDYWGRISFTADPSGKKRKNQDGTEGDVELIAFPAEVYPDEGAAALAAGEKVSTSTEGNGKVPPGWDLKTWESVLPDMRKMKEAGKPLPEIAGAYAVPVQYVAGALS